MAYHPLKHSLKQPIERLISSWASSTNFGAATSALPFASRTTFKNSSSSSSSSFSSHSSSAAACINPSLHKDRINFSLLLSASFASLAVIDGLASGKGSSSSNLSLNGDSPLSVHDSLGELVCAFINEKGPGKVVSEDVHFINEELGVLAVFDGVGGWKGITRPEAFPLALRQGLEHELNHQTTTATAGHAKHASQTLHSIAPNSIELPAQSQSPNSATHNTLHSHSQHHSRAHSHNHPASSTHSLHPSSSSSSNPSSSSLSPSHLLSRAHEFAKHEVELGSSTACIIVVDKESAKFDSANLGDSGWYLFKSASKNIELWSEEQQHYWNCPYQIGGSKSKADKVDMADLHGEIGLDDGDILLLATDGLSDNLFREEINKVIQNKFRLKLSRDELHDIAKDLYNEAHKKFDSLENTPFREHYFKHTKKHQRHANFFEGSYGKPDDLCVIIAQYSKNAIEKKASEKPL